MTIPALMPNGELPAGQHKATLDEVELAYGLASNSRRTLMQGLREAAHNFEQAGVKKIWVNGSFVTAKKHPNDIDGCWEYSNSVDAAKLDQVFLTGKREDAKTKYGLDFFIAQIIEAGSGLPFPSFFQVNRDGDKKGIIIVRLGG